MNDPNTTTSPPIDVLSSYFDEVVPKTQAGNPQLYKTAVGPSEARHVVPGSAARDAHLKYRAAANTTQLHNDRDPNLVIKSEKPEHRIIIFLKAQGLSNVEIAERTGNSGPWIGQVLRQPWARQRLLEELDSLGRDAARELLAGQCVDSILTAVDLRDNPKTPPGVRLAAANSLLDRHLGKPVQHVESVAHKGMDLSNVEDIDRKIKLAEEEERRILGERATSNA